MDYKLGLIGYPIQHSLSPWIHEQFLQSANLTGSYSKFEIAPDQSFAAKMEMLKESQIDGFNITVPYKETIIPYLDEIDDAAKKMGAVNTVVNRNGLWIGYNTDGSGYVRALESKFPALFTAGPKRILIIGAGGAARGIYYALITNGNTYVDIANRTVASAMDIASLKKTDTITQILTLSEAEEVLADYDLIIQTTSVGMRPLTTEKVLSLHNLKQGCIVSDIVYQPLETAFLTEAKTLGGQIHHGHTMLLYQAQYAFEIWTNKRVSLANMDEQLQHILEGR